MNWFLGAIVALALAIPVANAQARQCRDILANGTFGYARHRDNAYFNQIV